MTLWRMGCIGAGPRTRPRNWTIWTLTRAVRSFARVVRNWAAQWPWRASHREFPRHSKRQEKNWEAPWIQTDPCSRASHPNMAGQAFPDVSWDNMRQQHSSDIIRYHQIIGCVFFDAVALVCLGVAFQITRKNTWRSVWWVCDHYRAGRICPTLRFRRPWQIRSPQGIWPQGLHIWVCLKIGYTIIPPNGFKDFHGGSGFQQAVAEDAWRREEVFAEGRHVGKYWFLFLPVKSVERFETLSRKGCWRMLKDREISRGWWANYIQLPSPKKTEMTCPQLSSLKRFAPYRFTHGNCWTSQQRKMCKRLHYGLEYLENRNSPLS